MVHLRQVTKAYETASGPVPVLRGIELIVGEGEFVSILGPSGAGKSTLLNVITGIDRPTTGEVIVAGTAIHNLAENRLARWRGLNVGVVFQFFQLLPSLTILENVILPMDFCRLYGRAERVERGLELLESVGVAQHADKLPSALSGGEQQRVAIARALANDPPLIVADEPTGNLDSETSSRVLALFHRLREQGKTLLVVTHDRDLAKETLREVHLRDGRVEPTQPLAGNGRGTSPAGEA